MTGCVCKFPGWCERHQVKKTEYLHKLCSNDERYFSAWEGGYGPLQRPGLDKPKKRRLLGPGTILERKIKEFGYRHSVGCGCQSMVNKMNRWGADGCLKNIDAIIHHLEEAAKKTGWLERFAVTCPLVKKYARREIRKLVESAIQETEKQNKQEGLI